MKILEMLSYTRPAGSEAEAEFIERWIKPLGATLWSGNWCVDVPGGDGRTLFSCHTDTVHRESGRQTVLYDEELQVAYKDDKQPLGGDNTAGVWLLTEMITRGIPGSYMFHYGEEKGCIGSRQFAHDSKDWLSHFDRAVAFDRRGTTSIITHQMSSRCCSDVFAKALAAALGNDYVPDDTGLFTDTASYTHLIPECTNVSVGYDHEHGPDEILDIDHLNRLLELVTAVDWDALPVVREPAVESARESRYQDFAYEWDVDLDDEDEIDELCAAAADDCETLKDAQLLCRWDPDYAGSLLFALTRRELGLSYFPKKPKNLAAVYEE